jgi:hypothetical protein
MYINKNDSLSYKSSNSTSTFCALQIQTAYLYLEIPYLPSSTEYNNTTVTINNTTHELDTIFI